MQSELVPLAPFEEAGSGDDESRDMKLLAVALFDAHLKREDGEWLNEKLVTMRDVVRCARVNRIFEDKLGSLDDVFRDLRNRKQFKWDEVPDGATVDAFGEEIPPAEIRMREPDEDEGRLQAAAYIDEKVGSTFGKYFKKHAAIDGRYFTASNGALYAFGDRGSSKGSRYLLRRVTP